MLTKNIFIKNHKQHAGKWIYKGYENAWASHDYSVKLYDRIEEVLEFQDEYSIMAIDGDIVSDSAIIALSRAQRAYLFAQPNLFPEPWGRHPNFVSRCPDKSIKIINNLDNVYLWTFSEVNRTFFHKWKEVATVPLAFDSISYGPIPDKKYAFDVCFIGGWANNGFNEKKKIMLNFFKELKKLKIKHGIFINKNLTHEQENKILHNSKIAINIHDAYQHALGLDINERTFKSLGLNGFLINDNVRQIKTIFPEELYDIPIAKDPVTMRKLVEFYLDKNLDSIKMYNRQMISRKHTYSQRVREMLSW